MREELRSKRLLATLRGEAHVTDEAYDATGALRSATLTWIKAGNRKMKDCLGHFTALKCSSRSPTRMAVHRERP
jgi:hypothetical protein